MNTPAHPPATQHTNQPQHSGQPAARRKLRALRITLATLLTTAFILLLADTLVAARVEYQVSRHLYAHSNLPTPPAVELAGFPYTGAALSHELEAISVNAKDVDVPGFGLVSVKSSAQYVTVTPRQVFTGIIHNAPARKVFTRLQLDVVSLGKRLHIPNLQIQNKDDISPRGGWETEALFEGTPTGFHHPATVQVSLRLHNGDVELRPVSVISGPDGKGEKARTLKGDKLASEMKEEIRKHFALKLPAHDLPIKGIPMRVYVAGGSLYIESEKFYTTISTDELIPPSRDLPEAEKPRL